MRIQHAMARVAAQFSYPFAREQCLPIGVIAPRICTGHGMLCLYETSRATERLLRERGSR